MATGKYQTVELLPNHIGFKQVICVPGVREFTPSLPTGRPSSLTYPCRVSLQGLAKFLHSFLAGFCSNLADILQNLPGFCKNLASCKDFGHFLA